MDVGLHGWGVHPRCTKGTLSGEGFVFQVIFFFSFFKTKRCVAIHLIKAFYSILFVPNRTLAEGLSKTKKCPSFLFPITSRPF